MVLWIFCAISTVVLGYLLFNLLSAGAVIEKTLTHEMPVIPGVIERGVNPSAKVQCAYCGMDIPATSGECPMCHGNMNKIRTEQIYRPKPAQTGEALICIRCGRLNNPNRNECKTCHIPLEKPVLTRDDQFGL